MVWTVWAKNMQNFKNIAKPTLGHVSVFDLVNISVIASQIIKELLVSVECGLYNAQLKGFHMIKSKTPKLVSVKI